jgi:hypothetical protein
VSGHWYCSYCNDIKFLPAPANTAESEAVERCLDCKNNSLVWVTHASSLRGRVTVERANELFQQVKEAAQ